MNYLKKKTFALTRTSNVESIRTTDSYVYDIKYIVAYEYMWIKSKKTLTVSYLSYSVCKTLYPLSFTHRSWIFYGESSKANRYISNCRQLLTEKCNVIIVGPPNSGAWETSFRWWRSNDAALCGCDCVKVCKTYCRHFTVQCNLENLKRRKVSHFHRGTTNFKLNIINS